MAARASTQRSGVGKTKPKKSEVLEDSYIACFGSGILHPQAFLRVKKGPSGVLFVKCPLCRFSGFLPASGGWEKAKWLTLTEIQGMNREALVLP